MGQVAGSKLAQNRDRTNRGIEAGLLQDGLQKGTGHVGDGCLTGRKQSTLDEGRTQDMCWMCKIGAQEGQRRGAECRGLEDWR